MILDGKKIAASLRGQIQSKISAIPFKPILCDVMVGNDPVSLSYVQIKERAALEIGLGFKLEKLSEEVSTEEVIATIQRAQIQSELCGLIVQLPLPRHIDRQLVLESINPEIDVDCLGSKTSSLFYNNEAVLTPPTAAAIAYVLDSIPEDLSGKRFLVIGQGELVGKPITHILKQRGLQVTTADSATENLAGIIPYADVVIAGTGQPKLLYGSLIKPGAIVIDAGTAESGGGIVGDVDFESVAQVASYISPVPGGVGPVTVAKLLENVIIVANRRARSK